MRTALFVLLPVIASIALVQRRRVAALIGMGLLSFALSATYALQNAPDVAMTEAAIGAALVTTIYVLAIRRTGRLIVVADEAPNLLARKGERLVGLEYEILEGFARELGLDLSIRFLPREAVEASLLAGEADLAAGGIVRSDDPRFRATAGYLATSLVRIGGGSRGPEPPYTGYFSELLESIREGKEITATLDLARFIEAMRSGLTGFELERLPGEREYAFLVSRKREGLHAKLEGYLRELRVGGKLDEMIRRNLR